jgi:hypothetical protein
MRETLKYQGYTIVAFISPQYFEQYVCGCVFGNRAGPFNMHRIIFFIIMSNLEGIYTVLYKLTVIL